MGAGGLHEAADNEHMNGRTSLTRASLLAGLLALLLLAAPVQPVAAEPAAQAVNVEVSPAFVEIYPLGSARVQMVLTNPSSSSQVFVLEILLLREDGTIARAYQSDAVSLAPGYTVSAIYRVEHADGAVRAKVTPRSWPELSE